MRKLFPARSLTDYIKVWHITTELKKDENMAGKSRFQSYAPCPNKL